MGLAPANQRSRVAVTTISSNSKPQSKEGTARAWELLQQEAEPASSVLSLRSAIWVHMVSGWVVMAVKEVQQ